MSYFDFDGEVEVSVTAHKEEIKAARIRPLSYGITPQVSGNTLTFKLNSPQLVDRSQRRHLSQPSPLRQSDRPEQSAETGHEPEEVEKDRNLIYFAPGMHRLPGDTLNVPSGKTVYIAGGAIVRLHPSGKRTGCEGFRKRGSTPRRPWGRYQNHQFQKHRGRRRYDHAMPHRWLGQRDDTQRKGYQLLRMGDGMNCLPATTYCSTACSAAIPMTVPPCMPPVWDSMAGAGTSPCRTPRSGRT